MSEENKGREGFEYFKWWQSDVCGLKASGITNEQMGKLFFDVMSYAETGIKADTEPIIRMVAELFYAKVDTAQKKYKKACEPKSDNGHKGGEAKAENTKMREDFGEAHPESSLHIPSKTEFRKMGKSLIAAIKKEYDEDDKLKYDEYSVDKFYSKLKADKWIVGGFPIKNNTCLEAILYAHLAFEIDTDFWDICLHVIQADEEHEVDIEDINFFYDVQNSDGTFTVGKNTYKSIREYIDDRNNRRASESDAPKKTTGTF